VRALAISAAVTLALVGAWKAVSFGIQGDTALAKAVEQSYRADYEQGRSAEPKQVWCTPSAFTPELVERSQNIGSDGPFDDCTVSFSDGTRTTSCWSKAGNAYHLVWSPQANDSADSAAGCGGLLFRPVTPRWPTAWGTVDLSAR
jgi:hypothetical protein